MYIDEWAWVDGTGVEAGMGGGESASVAGSSSGPGGAGGGSGYFGAEGYNSIVPYLTSTGDPTKTKEYKAMMEKVWSQAKKLKMGSNAEGDDLVYFGGPGGAKAEFDRSNGGFFIENKEAAANFIYENSYKYAREMSFIEYKIGGLRLFYIASSKGNDEISNSFNPSEIPGLGRYMVTQSHSHNTQNAPNFLPFPFPSWEDYYIATMYRGIKFQVIDCPTQIPFYRNVYEIDNRDRLFFEKNYIYFRGVNSKPMFGITPMPPFFNVNWEDYIKE